MRRNRVQEEWNSFAKAALPAECSELQRQEMRRAFYAGVRMLLSKLLHDLTPGDEAEQADLEMLRDMEAELQDFVERVKVGAA